MLDASSLLPMRSLGHGLPALMQIYGKTGQWEEAVKVLDSLQAQVKPRILS